MYTYKMYINHDIFQHSFSAVSRAEGLLQSMLTHAEIPTLAAADEDGGVRAVSNTKLVLLVWAQVPISQYCSHCSQVR